ncbi:proton-conducting transporter membrane subunit [Cryobacterium sp. CG_9.6]|uniref:proton-conducting transporter transmembrane domain-containing protein n=1 Tax=Cryobacterium sp. CG_9.6 TaxID=2760710 RepID=UPI0024771426|nr:proton-conducting transporter membrane subunit [Cryobacterium sp. CG_9.6]MDH6238320.1 NADH:ubiquinone oxidoreductase subunit 5 (subunit L)/multisubunit Na+/H+ antiporter MnhA subunit [Cryobacterium sp. CG_9.6]
MVEAALMACILTAVFLAPLSGALLGRWAADAAARCAATLVLNGSLAAICLGLLRLTASADRGPLLLGPLSVDALSLLMLIFVLGLSALIQFFAVRYLRGDTRQVWFVVTVNLVTGFTALLVCTSTVLGFGLAWMAAGASLVALLATYPHLPQARDGVRRTATRVVIGDAPLVTAIVILMVAAGGDVPLADLGTVLGTLPVALAAVIALLLVIPALARSSQVPFHGWLPATLAAPTPVSALMHAGVVNAGAILILRFSPAIGESVPAMAVLFGAGTLTLIYASTVRLIKPDVKGRLVFSTMAQMGFMMLACGMGAFAAAVFHLIAHGFFKSALFLGAGSAVEREATQRAWPARQLTSRPHAIGSLVVAVTVSGGAIIAARIVLGIELSPASQALQLFVVFTATVALATTLRTHFSVSTALLGSSAIIALTLGYTAFINAFDTMLNVESVPAAVNPWWMLVPAAALFALPLLQRLPPGNRVSHHLYALALAAGTATAAPTRTPKAVPEGALL